MILLVSNKDSLPLSFKSITVYLYFQELICCAMNQENYKLPHEMKAIENILTGDYIILTIVTKIRTLSSASEHTERVDIPSSLPLSEE